VQRVAAEVALYMHLHVHTGDWMRKVSIGLLLPLRRVNDIRVSDLHVMVPIGCIGIVNPGH